MTILDLKFIYEDTLRQIEKEKAHYAKTQNQIEFFNCIEEELKITEILKKINK